MKRRKAAKKGLVFGVTGNLGSGKTTVSKLMARSLRALVIDADEIAHDLLNPRKNIFRRLVKTFGSGIVGRNGAIDRKLLADKAFRNRVSLSRLNAIMHPPIIKSIKEAVCRSKKANIIIDAPLLIESGFYRYVDKLVVVRTDYARALERLCRKKSSFRKCEILKRMKFQMPLSKKVRFADFIIDNNGTLKSTKKQIGMISRSLVRPRRTRD